MIDRVQQTLEQLAPELDTYLKKKIFTQREIQKIIDTRRNFEYKLLRNQQRLEYYLNYIESEHKLEKIRNSRIVKFNLTSSDTDTLLDKNVLNVYCRALSKFVEPILVKSFVDFCISKSFYDEMKGIIKDVSLKNTTNPDLWIFFSQTLWQINDFGAARNMFLQYLSINKDKRVGIEFFRLECLYSVKINRINKELGIEEEADNDIEKGEIAFVVFKSLIPLEKQYIEECIEIAKMVPGLEEKIQDMLKGSTS